MNCQFLKVVSVSLILGASLSMSGNASATLIESIAALDDGAMYRVVFVTSTTNSAITEDISMYNYFVSSAAANGSVTSSLGLTWAALAGTKEVSAQANTGIFYDDTGLVTIFNTFGEIVATSGSDLWDGVLSSAIIGSESGAVLSVDVLTGIRYNGDSYDTYALGEHYGGWMAGHSSQTNSNWVANGVSSPFAEYSFYAASSVVEKIRVDVPEPGTLIMLSLGLAGLSFSRYRKQS
ncbi:hypothetical protein A3Q34_02525 [Colwellia sp. PAMC 20917]|nr:hypothetical protein A3Q34_02525 [Colwellia sp. PAMC 20917]